MNRAPLCHLRPSDYRVMPWKNGGGTTTELIIEPSGASLDSGFLWRLSMAEVGVSGPFSRFDGYDRTLLLLEGRGMRLEFDQGEPVQLDRLLEPAAFRGERLTSGILLDGPCRDFNIITQRARCLHRLETLHLDTRSRPIFQAPLRFIFCAKGMARLNAIELSAMELLRVEDGTQTLEASARGPAGAVIIAIGITPAEAE
jgi:environmental stress-induced protein Ves